MKWSNLNHSRFYHFICIDQIKIDWAQINQFKRETFTFSVSPYHWILEEWLKWGHKYRKMCNQMKQYSQNSDPKPSHYLVFSAVFLDFPHTPNNESCLPFRGWTGVPFTCIEAQIFRGILRRLLWSQATFSIT